MLLVVGDSHAGFFSGRSRRPWPMWPEWLLCDIPGIDAVHLGPTLAYNLGQLGHGSTPRLAGVLEAWPNATTLFVFGEIDCRMHLVPRGRDVGAGALIGDLVSRYMAVLSRIAESRPVIVWGPIASTPREDAASEDYCAEGTCTERNAMTAALNGSLACECARRGLRFATIFDKMLLPDGTTRPELLSDGVHLGAQAAPLVFGALSAVAPELDLSAWATHAWRDEE